MKTLILLATATILTASCTFDTGDPTLCRQVKPRLEGTWRGAMSGQQLTVQMTERCISFGFGDPSWLVEGQWSWSGQSGVATATHSSNFAEILMRLGTSPQPTSNTTFRYNGNLPLGTTMTGFVKGRWRLPTDTMNIVGTFDSVAVTLQRQ
jgi:hypothetical protein